MFTTYLCLLSTFSAPPPKPVDQPVYFPTAVGTKWETLLSGQPNGEDIRYSYSIAGVEEKDGQKIVSVKRHVGDTTIDAGRYQLSQDGITVVPSARAARGRANPMQKPNDPMTVLEFPIKKDESWKWAGKLPTGADSAVTRTIRAIEEITVPAGKFRAVKIEVVQTRTNSGVVEWNMKSTEWYAEGVGRIKHVAENLTEEMTKFTPAEKK
jgi:hypothetical protein